MRKKSQIKALSGYDGEWLDVGIGECPRCCVERRMFRPVSRLDVYLCAPCTQPGVLATLSNEDRAELEEAA